MGQFTHALNKKFGDSPDHDEPCCPKCSNETSKGFLVEEDTFCDTGDVIGIWIREAKCYNCGWRLELCTWKTVGRVA